jgi:transcriptional regulator with XRE-family HTH domain
MSTKTGRAIRELRDIINLTQGEFAAMIGASKDTVASWEVGRNKLSRQFARRIALATGVEADDLMRGRSPLMTHVPMAGRLPLTAETFQRHRQSYWGATDEAAARRHLKNAADALGLILLAAAGGPDEKGAKCLPAVLESFIEWCEQTREDFQLDPEIQPQLEERKSKIELTKTYKQWRINQREDPEMCRLMGFKDDPKKRDDETLRLSMETVPLWRPGYAMRAPQKEG